MALAHGKATKVYLNGADLTAFLKSVGLSSDSDVADVSVFGTNAKAYIAGLKDATLNAGGFYDPAAAGSDARLRAALGGDLGPHKWTVYPQGDALGSFGYGMPASGTKYAIDESLSDAVGIAVEAQSSSALDTVLSQHALGLEAATINHTAIDNAALTNNGGVGYLHVSAATALTTCTIKIQHSVDNTTFADLITFVAVTAAPNSQRIVVPAGTLVNRYVRAAITTLTGTNITYNAAFGRN